jgi:hypothetical protein
VNNKTLMILGALGLVIGPFLPWASMTAPLVGTVTITGMKGDGIIFLVVGILLLLDSLTRKPKPGHNAGVLRLIFGVASLLLALYDLINIFNVVNNPQSRLIVSSVGIGVPVILIGALLYLAGAAQKVPDLIPASAAPAAAAPEPQIPTPVE